MHLHVTYAEVLASVFQRTLPFIESHQTVDPGERAEQRL